MRVNNVRISLDCGLPGHDATIRAAIAKALKVPPSQIESFQLVRRSVDARHKNNVHFIANFDVQLKDEPAIEEPNASATYIHAASALIKGTMAPVVVGSGPAGLFCALELARAGLEPILIERGGCVEERNRKIATFNDGGELDLNCNVQFGEGGAGTFSDGKLYTGKTSPRIKHILQTFVAAGAPEEILWQARPHIGTDKLAATVRGLREMIIAEGGKVHFNMQLVDIVTNEGAVRGIVGKDLNSGMDVEFETEKLVLATGHSARDVFELLQRKGATLEAKPFSIGVRIEHPRSAVDFAQYGKAAGHPALGAADYKLACHLPNGRGVYTFCMCPGGEVVAAASEDGGVVTNGMSRFARNARNSNAAFLVGIEPEDVASFAHSKDPLAGVEFQQHWERGAYALAGGNYKAPAQLLSDFCSGFKSSGPGNVEPSYPRGVTWTDLSECLPSYVTESLRAAVPLFNDKLSCFAMKDAVLTGVETRSSSPVRIVRNKETLQSNIAGLYPCGEGAGYAGGITSAAIDGLRVAECLLGVS